MVHFSIRLNSVYDKYDVQSNIINSKSSGLEILFGIIRRSNYWEIDLKIYNCPKMIIISFFSIKHMFWACKRNVSLRTKTYDITSSY